LGLQQEEASVRVVEDAISLLTADYPARSYLRLTRNAVRRRLGGYVLHGRGAFTPSMTVSISAGLVFQGWLNKAPYCAHDLFTQSSDFIRPSTVA
jgi:hypothetical protein